MTPFGHAIASRPVGLPARRADRCGSRQRLSANSPYNADLPYDIKQKAVFGEASYDFGQFKLTGGGRY